MRTRLSKTLLSIILCASLVPLGGLGTAWADEGGRGADTADTPAGAAPNIAEAGSDGLPAEAGGNSVAPGPEGGRPALAQGNGTAGGGGLNAALPGGSQDDTDLLPEAPQNNAGLPEASQEAIGISSPMAPEALAPYYSVEYRAHVADIGWQGWVADGKTAGTTGRSLSIEALNLRLSGQGLSGSIEYRTHVQDLGWQPWVADGAQSGTTGRGLRTEAVSIRLTGELAAGYDVYYRVHAQDFGWLGWAADGEDAGTAKYGYRMEALEVRLVAKGGPAPSPLGGAFKEKPMALETRGHAQDVGWQAWQADGGTSGTTGRGLRLEALCARVTNPELSGSVEYQAHVQDVGWQGWRSDGAVAGTTGRSLRIEAVQMRLSGSLAEHYDLYYRVHCANFGWLGWAKNGETAGSVGLSLRVEAFQARLVPKGGTAPGETAGHALEVTYTSQADVAGKGWMPPVAGSGIVGTVGQSRRMEAFKIAVGGTIAGGIEYNAYVQDIGWQGWKKDGAVAGTEGEGKRIEAVRMRLTGDLASYFDIYYRAQSANFGWLGWAKDGANAGTSKLDLRLEAFQVVISAKGASAPGSTSGAYWDAPPLPPSYKAMNGRIANVSSPTGWAIAIDSTNCLVGIYYGAKGHWTNKYMWLCSPGTKATPTVKGTFSIGSRGYVFGSGFSCYYWTQFYGDYLFHSVLYYPGTRDFMEGTMGVPGSHGCVRLDIQNAKWIYDNIPSGTTVISY